MRQRQKAAVVAIALALAIPVVCAGELDPAAGLSIEQRLADFAGRMRLGLSIASVAVFSPTARDAHAQAERLVLLLRGDARAEVPGLLAECGSLLDRIASRPFEAQERQELEGAGENVRVFLQLAGESAALASRARALVNANEGLLRAYACLVAAWGQPIDGIVVPGLITLLRAFDVPAEV